MTIPWTSKKQFYWPKYELRFQNWLIDNPRKSYSSSWIVIETVVREPIRVNHIHKNDWTRENVSLVFEEKVLFPWFLVSLVFFGRVAPKKLRIFPGYRWFPPFLGNRWTKLKNVNQFHQKIRKHWPKPLNRWETVERNNMSCNRLETAERNNNYVMTL